MQVFFKLRKEVVKSLCLDMLKEIDPCLVHSRLSLSLLSGARGVMGRRKARERVFLPFPFPSPPAPAARVTRRRVGRVRIDPSIRTEHIPNHIQWPIWNCRPTLIALLAPAKEDSSNHEIKSTVRYRKFCSSHLRIIKPFSKMCFQLIIIPLA